MHACMVGVRNLWNSKGGTWQEVLNMYHGDSVYQQNGGRGVLQ